MAPTSREGEDAPYVEPIPEDVDPLAIVPELEPVVLVEEHYPPDPNAPRHRAAHILSVLFATSFLIVIAAEMIRSVWYGLPLSNNATTLMLTVGSLLVGLSSGYLARNLNTPPGDRHELQTKVGTVVVATLGGMLLILSIAHLLSIFASNGSTAISDNATNVLVVLLGGIVGALGGYLGIRTSEQQPTKK